MNKNLHRPYKGETVIVRYDDGSAEKNSYPHYEFTSKFVDTGFLSDDGSRPIVWVFDDKDDLPAMRVILEQDIISVTSKSKGAKEVIAALEATVNRNDVGPVSDAVMAIVSEAINKLTVLT